MTWRIHPRFASVVLLASFGCADPRYADGARDTDAGDAGLAPTEQAQTPSSVPDSGARSDGGPVTDGGEVVSLDGAVEDAANAAVPQHDASTNVDAGPPEPPTPPVEVVDTGSTARDAGTPSQDAGPAPTTPPDAGAPAPPDAGTPPPATGCPADLVCNMEPTGTVAGILSQFTGGLPFCADTTMLPPPCVDNASCSSQGFTKATCLDTQFFGKFCVQTCP